MKDKQLRLCMDGMSRKDAQDDQISLVVAQALGTPSGKEVLKYLRSITIEMVNGPNVDNDTLRHIEGQRYIVGLLESRVAHGNKVKNNE